MELEIEDVQQFFRIHRALLLFVDRRLEVTGRKLASPEDYASLPPETRLKVHDALLAHLELIDAFADENPSGLDPADLEIVRSWKHVVSGKFYAFRHLRDHTIFLSTTEPVLAYGVVALFDPFEKTIGTQLPRMIKTNLLPFKGRIVYDGLVTAYSISFGPGIRRRLNESYQEAKARTGIITSLPRSECWQPFRPQPKVAPSRPKKAKAKATRSGPAAPSPAREAEDRVVALTDAFCRDHLDEEYAALCRKLAGVLARKRPSPMIRGKPESWAAGIVRVIGWVNFLGDPSQPHHMRMSDVDAGFGVSEATGAAKSKAIRDLIRIDPFDPDWTLPALMDQNPMAWMIQVNGLIVDARQLPREIQEEALRKGLIPYIPGDRGAGPGGD